MRVFVYGTLRRGEPNAYLISDASRGVAKFIGFGTTVQKFPLIVYGRFNTPFLLDEAGTGKVSGLRKGRTTISPLKGNIAYKLAHW